MRRVLLLILLTILPLQFAWAAATAYCQHESGEATKHFGHHEHQHRAAADAAAKDTKVSSSALADTDCGTCHLTAAQPIPSAISRLEALAADPPRFGYRASYDSFIPTGPERPDRSAPAPAVRFGGVVGIGASLSA